jgi:hypothetical protein
VGEDELRAFLSDTLYTPDTPPVPQACSTIPASSVVWRGLACRVEMVSPVIGYQERQELWLSQDALRDSSSWSSSPLVLLRDIHANLLTKYDCKEVCAPSQSQGNVGASDQVPRTVSLSSRRLLLCPFRS